MISYTRLPLDTALLIWCTVWLSIAPPTVTAEDHPQWTFEKCRQPADKDNPISSYTPNILNLARMNYISDSFWFQISWSSEPQVSCGLRHNVLYFVEKQTSSDNLRSYVFTSYTSYAAWTQRATRDAVFEQIVCGGSIAFLGQGSYGFVSCTPDYGKAQEEARAWREGIPQSFFLILIGVIGGLVVLISIVGIVAFVVSRKKLTGIFSLHNHRMESKLAPPEQCLGPPS